MKPNTMKDQLPYF